MPEAKYELLKNAIKEKIRNGIWKEGEKVPAQRTLEELFGVSRITVKKAVSDLVNENYIEHLPGKKNLFIKKQNEIAGTKTIAVAIDCVTDRFGGTLLRGIEDSLWKEKYHTIICNADRDFSKVEEYFDSFDFGKIDGIIFAPVIDEGYLKKNGQIIRMLEKKGIPYVLVDRYIPGIQSNYVVSDDRESARLMTNSLIRSGHRRILIGAGLQCSSMMDRIAGVKQAFSENGIEFDDRLLIEVNDNLFESDMNLLEIEHAKELISQTGGFTAFYAQNDRILNAGMHTMFEIGLDLNSIQLALHNEVSKPMHPHTDHIPHVIPPVYRMGYTAAGILLNNIRKGEDSISQIIIRNRVVYEDLIKP